MTPTADRELAVDYFDGRSARAHRVALRIDDGALAIRGEAIDLRLPVSRVQWPERTRHGPRIARLPEGASLQSLDGPAWDAWARDSGLRESSVVAAQQSWRGVLVCVALLVASVAAFYVWGMPWAARAVVAMTPASAEREIGDLALRGLSEGGFLASSAIPAAEQQRWRARLDEALARAYPDAATRPVIDLHFAAGKLGANAFALPGGVVVIGDELIALVDRRDDAVIGVLAHEAGHVRHRHGLRLVVQAGLLGMLSSVVIGDFSQMMAAAPVLLGHASYSRDFEREADGQALHVLRANGLSSQGMVLLFEKLAQRSKHADDALGIALASHPADAERIARFKAEAP